MADRPRIDDLLSRLDVDVFRAALEEAYRRGAEDERERVLRAISGTNSPLTPAPMPDSPVVFGMMRAGPGVYYGGGLAITRDDDEEARRAPRGLTREIVTMILREEPGLPIEEIQQRATAFDRRLSAKTVYNELNREKGNLYRASLGRWYLRSEGDAESSQEEEALDI